MVAPSRHVGDLGDLTDEEALEIHRLGARSPRAGRRVRAGRLQPRLEPRLRPAAGAVDHVHLHVVPRWAGDTNFMPVLADVRVLPEHLVESRRRLADAWPA